MSYGIELDHHRATDLSGHELGLSVITSQRNVLSPLVYVDDGQCFQGISSKLSLA